MRIAPYFGASARFWLNRQTAYQAADAEAGQIVAEVAPAASLIRLYPGAAANLLAEGRRGGGGRWG